MSVKTWNMDVVLPLQTGMILETGQYQEQRLHYGGVPVLYYQFNMGGSKGFLPILPDGCIDILFECSSAHPSGWVCGSVLKGGDIPFLPHSAYFGVRLPMGASLSWKILPFRETLNRRIPLSDVIPGAAHAGAAIGEASVFRQRIQAFEQLLLPFILQEAQVPPLVKQCLHYMVQSDDRLSIEDIALRLGYTSRYIRRKFEDFIGMSPKLYSRIIRFHHALQQLAGSPTFDSSPKDTVIYGYYDQSHFVKECKQFTSFTPNKLLQGLRADSAAVSS